MPLLEGLENLSKSCESYGYIVLDFLLAPRVHMFKVATQISYSIPKNITSEPPWSRSLHIADTIILIMGIGPPCQDSHRVLVISSGDAL